MLAGLWTALLLVAAASVGIVATTAFAGKTNPDPARIAFFGDIGNIISSKNPLLIRPSTLLLTEDGAVALVHLRWRAWDTSIARASGVWSASSCTPSCATGKRTTSPVRLTLSSPGLAAGHWVYRCFRIDPPHPERDIEDRACIRRQGSFYAYAAVPDR